MRTSKSSRQTEGAFGAQSLEAHKKSSCKAKGGKWWDWCVSKNISARYNGHLEAACAKKLHGARARHVEAGGEDSDDNESSPAYRESERPRPPASSKKSSNRNRFYVTSTWTMTTMLTLRTGLPCPATTAMQLQQNPR